jgi:hypothetical protein
MTIIECLESVKYGNLDIYVISGFLTLTCINMWKVEDYGIS